MVVAVLSSRGSERQQRDARLCRVRPGKLRTGSVNRGSHRGAEKKPGPTRPAIPTPGQTTARHAHREGKLTENVREDARSAGEPKGTRTGAGRRRHGSDTACGGGEGRPGVRPGTAERE